jgi:hypothetical protein
MPSPPQRSVAAVHVGREELVDEIAIRAADLDRVESGFARGTGRGGDAGNGLLDLPPSSRDRGWRQRRAAIKEVGVGDATDMHQLRRDPAAARMHAGDDAAPALHLRRAVEARDVDVAAAG